MIRIAFFEDHPIVVRSLKTLIESEPNLELIFYASEKMDLYQKLEIFYEIDVLVLDFLATDVRGLELYEYLKNKFSAIKVISFTSLSSPILVENLLLTGVKAYVNKSQELEDLVTAINMVFEGNIYLPSDYSFLLKNNEKLNNTILSQREVELVQLISREFTSSDIAKQLGLSIYTIENHRKNIFGKLNVKNVAGMIREASKLGYLE